MTILRRIMVLPDSTARAVTVLGITDFSFKRGRKFGTILVDVNRHQVIDLLPERKSESVAAWMQNHPEIQYVSRDRGNDYAQAAREGAPQATPVADRFHLLSSRPSLKDMKSVCLMWPIWRLASRYVGILI